MAEACRGRVEQEGKPGCQERCVGALDDTAHQRVSPPRRPFRLSVDRAGLDPGEPEDSGRGDGGDRAQVSERSSARIGTDRRL